MTSLLGRESTVIDKSTSSCVLTLHSGLTYLPACRMSHYCLVLGEVEVRGKTFSHDPLTNPDNVITSCHVRYGPLNVARHVGAPSRSMSLLRTLPRPRLLTAYLQPRRFYATEADVRAPAQAIPDETLGEYAIPEHANQLLMSFGMHLL